MVDIAGHYDETAEANNFDPIPAGDYRAKIIESDVEDVSKTADKGRCLVLKWQIETGQYDGRLVFQRLNMWFTGDEKEPGKVVKIANQQFAAVREATGKKVVKDTQELEHIPCMITVAIRTDPNGKYSPSNEIKNVKPVSGSQSGNVGGVPAPANSASAPGARRTAPWPTQRSA